MLKKLISSIMAFVMVMTLVVAVPVMATEVPDELKTDYVAGEDGNLITTYPQSGNLSINDGNVIASASDGLAILPAAAELGEHETWGFSGFHIDSLFNETWADAEQKPVFAQGDKILFAAKVRKAADATVDAKINIAYADAGRARKLYPDNYPSSSDGFNVTSTDWVDFKTVLTNPVADLDQYTNPTLGFAAGTQAGAKVEIDMATMYYGVEMPYDIEVTATNESAKATILNQLGDDYSGSQGGFTWYAMNADRTAIVDGIEVTDNGDGTADIAVSNEVAGGKYYIVAASDTYTGFVKGAEITVVSLKDDYVPADDGNLITNIPNGNLSINDGNVIASASDGLATLPAAAELGENETWGFSGFHIDSLFNGTWADAEQKPVFAQGDKILFAAKVRKAADATVDAKINIAYADAGRARKLYPDNYPSSSDGFNVTSTDWVDFKTVLTNPVADLDQYTNPTLGFAAGTQAGAKVEIDMATMYYGVEMPYDIEVTATNESATAKIVNQLGDDYSGSQGGFTWYAMNADRTAEVEGITVTDNGDGTAAVSVADTVAGGKYYIVAASDTYTGFVKGAEITVVSLKNDYIPADDGNLIDIYPEHSVDINSGEVGCAVSGTTVTLTANSAAGTSAEWGMQGFEINERFISTLSDGVAPVFPQETKVLISAKVRKAADATADAKINVSYASWYNVQYDGGSPKYTDTYPTVGDGFVVNSTDWMDFKAVMTVPASTDGNTWAYLFGLASGTEAGAKVEVDMTSMYFGAEMPYDIEVTATNESATAKIVNQIGLPFSGAQGGFTWYAMNADRTAEVAGIEVTDNGDGTAAVSVADTVAGGTYYIVAASDTYAGFAKGAEIKVVSIKNDYTPADDGNLIDQYPGEYVDINSGEVGCAVSGTTVTLTANSVTGTSSDWGMQGFEINERFISTLSDGVAPVFPQETKVLISAKVRKAADSTADAKINVSYSSWYNVQYDGGSPKYTDTYPTVGDGFVVNSTDWMDFKAVMTVPAKTDGNTWAYLFGLASGTEAGAKVEVDMTSIFFGAEVAYDIDVTIADTTATAKIVNQLGDDYSGSQGGFTWYAMNADRTDEIDGIEITDNGDGTATVSVADTVEDGIYDIIALSDTYTGFAKSAKLVVGSPIQGITLAQNGKKVTVYTDTALDNKSLIFASYNDNNKMVDCEIVYVTLDAQEIGDFAPVDLTQGAYTKVMLWDSMINFKPLASMIQY